MYSEVHSLPDGFFSVCAQELWRILPDSRPTLIHLEGAQPRPLFTSTLLHGNEDVGFRALQTVLAGYRRKKLPRSLSIFIGNVAAARHGIRRLPGQPDYNRVWPGGDEAPDSPEAAMMQRVTAMMKRRNVYLSVDLHNNAGVNPHYACINRLDPPFLHLGSLFSRTVVFFTRPRGVQSSAFSRLCPAVTLECGKIGNDLGVRHAAEFINACLHLRQLPAHPPAGQDIDLYHTVAIVKIPPQFTLGIDDDSADINLAGDIERYNFSELPPGTVLGTIRPGSGAHLEVVGENGDNALDRFIRIERGHILTTRPVMPSMLTTSIDAIRQDCLGYFMERLPLPHPSA